MPSSIIIRQPDDWHVHLRSGKLCIMATKHSSASFGRFLVMPNLKEPITNAELAKHYHQEIIQNLQDNQCNLHIGDPHIALYLTDTTTPNQVEAAAKLPFVRGFKYYPRGATTNAQFGVRDLLALDDTLAALSECNLALLLHGEVVTDTIDPFDRERVFVNTIVPKLLARHPKLRVILEHITTKESVDCVLAQRGRLHATITPHHLRYNRSELFRGGIRPHHYCLPLLQRERDRSALVMAATSGLPWFFAGTDSAPHDKHAKESDCGCAGVYNSPVALAIYAEVFAATSALSLLSNFMGRFGAECYQLPVASNTIELANIPWQVPSQYEYNKAQSGASEVVIPMAAGETLQWNKV